MKSRRTGSNESSSLRVLYGKRKAGKFRLTSIIVLGLAILAIGYFWLPDRGTSRTGRTTSSPTAISSPKLTERAVLDSEGLVVALPSVLLAIEPALPAEMNSARFFDGVIQAFPDPSLNQSNTWLFFTSSRGRLLRVSAVRRTDPDDAHRDFVSKRIQDSNIRRAGDKRPGVVTGPTIALRDLGDEAYAVRRMENASSQEDVENNVVRKYDIAGVTTCVRYRNVVICIDWEGADYGTSASREGVMKGRTFSFKKSLDTVYAIAEAIIGRLQ